MIVESGLIEFLAKKITLAQTCAMRLYVNNVTIMPTTLLEELEEASWGGYASFPLPTWSSPAININDVAQSNNEDFPTFENTTGSQVVYTGWFITDMSNTILIAALLLNASGIGLDPVSSVTFTPTLTDGNTDG